MHLKVEFKNVKKLQKKFTGIAVKTDKVADKQIPLALLAIHSDAVKSIQSSSAGKSYYRYSGGHKRYVTAAKAGQPPNTDTGGLVQSIKWEYNKRKNEGAVGTNLEYGKFLELSTKKMKARPWLWPAYKKNKKLIPKELAAAIKSSVYKKVKK
jgi:HK97 gp10 family phage protein